MRYATLRRLQRIVLLFCFIVGIAIAGMVAQTNGARIPLLGASPQVALISGHAGFDSGAICTGADGEVLLTEADVNATITQTVARKLRRRGVDVLVLDEYDPRLADVQVDVLLSLHSDSCVDESGYKAAASEQQRLPEQESRLIACIDQHYPRATGLVYHPYTVTNDMVGYYAFNRIPPTVPAAILEMGFLGGDQELLTRQPARVARGVFDSLICYIDSTESRDPTDPLETPVQS
jgi:N-acetylmuramoyl-L-alanine amidase